MMRRGVMAFLVAGLAISARGVLAQEGQISRSSLSEAARQASRNFQPVAPQDVARAKAELAAAMSGLDAFLRTGAPYKAVGWKRYLQWNDLVGILQSEQPPSADMASGLLGKLRANQTGLERPEFTRLRDAFANYVTATGAAANGKLQDEYAKRMEDLATQLEAYAKDPTAGDAALSIGRTVGWLESNGQASELIASIRRAYGRPNFFGHVSERFAAAGIDRDVDQVRPVRDNILGTDLHGTARLVGRTSLSLNENPSAASMNILLGGTAWSNNIGYNGPVTIYSTGVTSVSARKTVMMTAEGMFGYASQASCGTRSSINGIHAKCCLIERIAWRRAGQQKGQAEYIASQHAAGRVAGQMDFEAGGQIAEQNGRYLEKFRNPLVRRGEFPEELTFSTTRDRIQVQMLQQSAGMLAAPDEAPPGYARDHDLALRAHESAVTNFGQGLLGGYELTDLRLEKLIKDDLKGELSEELRVTQPDGTLDPEKEPWSIIFSKELPVRAKFDGGNVWMAIRADGFTRGEGDEPGKYRPAITELLEISAAYKIEKTDKGATLRRDGDVQVRFPNRANPEQITVRDSPIVTFIRRKFRSLFKDEFVGEGLVLKGQWEKAGRLELQEVAADQAWLRLGWNMPSAGATPAAAGAE
jgi:hypothetical protein